MVVRLDLAEGMVDVSLGVALLAVEVAPARVSVQRHREEHAVLSCPAVGLVTVQQPVTPLTNQR